MTKSSAMPEVDPVLTATKCPIPNTVTGMAVSMDVNIIRSTMLSVVLKPVLFDSRVAVSDPVISISAQRLIAVYDCPIFVNDARPAASKTVVNAAMVMYNAIAPWHVDIKAMPINAGRAIEEGSSFFTR